VRAGKRGHGTTAAKRAPPKVKDAVPSGTGTSVTGSVVGATKRPKLASRAGGAGGGIGGQAKATLAVTGVLLAFLVLGAFLDTRRPRRDARSTPAVAVAGGARLFAAARARGALAPFAIGLVGLALVVLPSATGMWSRAPKGATMIARFTPYLRAERLAAFQRDVDNLDAGVREATGKGPALLAPRASAAVTRRTFAAATRS